MRQEVLKFLDPKPNKVIIDCTVGCGGHAQDLLESLQPSGRLIGVDQDEESLSVAKEKLKKFNGMHTLIYGNFKNLVQILNDLKIAKVDGLLFDLGLSSFQLENLKRGFSFKQDGPLDMRMDRRNRISAYDLVNNLHQEEIDQILKDYGQERWHSRIVSAIVNERKRAPISTTTQLTDIVTRAIPRRFLMRYRKIHPATRTFQALRIAVNRELEALEGALEEVIPYVAQSGRICVISFHSLEDRIVKTKFRKFSKSGMLKIITKKPLTPSEEEVSINPRSRSAKLRVAERI
jgi:16S rRNA (cytosine1402-N4)-methyltransferase